MIERVLHCKDAFCTLLLEDDLDEFMLAEAEWRRLQSLRDLLKQFDRLTTEVCASRTYVTIPLTVMVYNKVMNILDDFQGDNRERLPDLTRGVDAAYSKLRKYYAATDLSPIYSVATTVHPSMRFQYWSEQEWGAEYERAAKESVRAVWTAQYAQTAVLTGDEATQPLEDLDECDDVELRLLGRTRQPTGDELERFVSQPTVRAKPTRNRLGAGKIKEQMLLSSWMDYFSRKERNGLVVSIHGVECPPIRM